MKVVGAAPTLRGIANARDRSESNKRGAFELYLRTGRRVAPNTAAIELKFNPWHDPTNGQFTVAPNGMVSTGRGDGSWGGGGFTGGGGGRFGGGGASGFWDGPVVIRRFPKTAPAGTTSPRSATIVARQSARATPVSPTGTHTIVKNGYSFRIDGQGRTREVKGRITLGGTNARSRAMQAGAGGIDRLPTDDGGHYIALRFNGPREVYNHFAQDRNHNRGEYRVIEGKWAKAVAQGHRVIVAIGPTYVGVSKRPAALYLNVVIDGVSYRRYVSNRASKTK